MPRAKLENRTTERSTVKNILKVKVKTKTKKEKEKEGERKQKSALHLPIAIATAFRSIVSIFEVLSVLLENYGETKRRIIAHKTHVRGYTPC